MESVSVVIPTYNRARMLSRALDSALAEIRETDEIVVVDDGSTDDTAAVVGRYADRVRYHRQDNAGAGAARNRGIDAAGNDLIAFLDSDDEWVPGKLEKQRRLMAARPEVVLSCSDFRVRHADGRISEHYLAHWHHDSRTYTELLGPPVMLSQLIGMPVEAGEDVAVHIGDLFYDMMSAMYVFTSTSMVRRSAAGKQFFFTEGIHIYEDWGCFGRLTGVGPTAFINADLAINHGHTEGRLTDVENYPRSIARIIVLEEVWGADPAFLAKHGEQYRELLDKQRVVKAAGLITEGRTAEARRELAMVRNAPRSHTFVAALPGPAARFVLWLRRLLSGVFGRG